MGVSAYRTWVVTTAAAAMILSALSVLAVIGIATWAEPRVAQREVAEIEEAGFSVSSRCRIEPGSVLRCPGVEGTDDECYRISRDARAEIVSLVGGLLHDHTLGASVCHVPRE